MRAWSRRDLITCGLSRVRARSAVPALPVKPEREWVQRRGSPRRRLLPLHRPPGAVAEAEFRALCTRCGDCAAACPHDAILPAPSRMGATAGTPLIDAAESPCWMCSDRPCATVCGPQALRVDGPPTMARAQLQPHACLAVRGVGCSACVERCPVPGAIGWEGARPRIDPSACTGCGVCLHVCPAPGKAILLLPLMERGGVC